MRPRDGTTRVVCHDNKIFKDTHSIPQHPIKGIVSGRTRSQLTILMSSYGNCPLDTRNTVVSHTLAEPFNGGKMKLRHGFILLARILRLKVRPTVCWCSKTINFSEQGTERSAA